MLQYLYMKKEASRIVNEQETELAELETLPKGTIVRRTIRGAERFYHQWREGNKTKSRYLKPSEILPLREQLARRKALTRESFMFHPPLQALEEACSSLDALRRYVVGAYGAEAFEQLYSIVKQQILEEPLGAIRTTALEAAGILRTSKTEIIDKTKTIETSILFTIPNLKRTLGRAAINDLLDDATFLHSSAQERKAAHETLKATLEERILEEEQILLALQTRASETVRVTALRFHGGGRAFVIADEEDLTCELYTVRNATQREEEMLIDLANPSRLDAVEHRYGLITARIVLYHGRNAQHPTGVIFKRLTSASCYES